MTSDGRSSREFGRRPETDTVDSSRPTSRWTGPSAGAFVVDEDTVLANRLGLVHTGPELHPLLWRFLSEHGPTAPARMQVPLSDGLHDAVVEPVDDGSRAAYSVRLLRQRSHGRPDATSRRVTGTSGSVRPIAVRERLHFHDDVDRQLETAIRHGELVALIGAGGTGKLQTALRTLRRHGVDDPLIVEPHLDPGWFAAAGAAAADGRGLVLRRVHASPSPSVAQVQTLVETGVAIALTADLDAADDGVVAMVRRVATTVRLPGLAQCREHLPSLVQEVLAERPEPESATRLAPRGVGPLDVLAVARQRRRAAPHRGRCWLAGPSGGIVEMRRPARRAPHAPA